MHIFAMPWLFWEIRKCNVYILLLISSHASFWNDDALECGEYLFFPEKKTTR